MRFLCFFLRLLWVTALAVLGPLGCRPTAAPDAVQEIPPPAQEPTLTLSSSDATPSPGPPASPRPELQPGQFGFVEKIAGQRVFLLQSNADPSWGSGAPRLLSPPNEAARVVKRELTAEVAERFKKLVGQKVDLYVGIDVVGHASVASLWVASISYDVEEDMRAVGAPRPSLETLAAAVLGGGTHWLVADLEPTIFPVTGASWARLAELPKPELPRLSLPTPQLISQAKALLANDPEVMEAQVQYAASHTQWKPNPNWQTDAVYTLHEFRHAGRQFVRAHVGVGAICEFNAHIARLYEVRSGKLEAARQQTGDSVIELLIDVDADGQLEAIVTPNLVLQSRLEGLFDQQVLMSNEQPDYGCRC